MILTFPDGTQMVRDVGASLCGFVIKGRRPATVTLTRRELNELRSRYSYLVVLEKALELDEIGIKRYLEKNKETRQA